MKVGRNDPCPCGSNKKYKKCCLNKEDSIDFPINMIFESLNDFEELDTAFPNIHIKTNAIKDVFSKYKFEDLITSVFCICSWIENRSVFESCLALNKALVENEKFGKMPIKSYEEFKQFFQELEKILTITSSDDLILSDFGQVHIIYKDKKFPIILGTGHEFVFCATQFIPEIAKLLCKEDFYYEALSYSSYLIENLKQHNISNNVEEKIMFNLPKEDFYYCVCKVISDINLSTIDNPLVTIFGNDSVSILRRHFFLKNGTVYPLFNTTLIVDCYRYLLSLATDQQKNSHVNSTITKILHSNFDFTNEDNPKVIYPVSIIKDGHCISRKPYLFMCHTEKSAIIAINKSDYTDQTLYDEIVLLRKTHSEDKLFIGEIMQRKNSEQYLMTKISKNDELMIIVCDNYTDISRPYYAGIGEVDYHYFTALDMCFVLNFIDDFDELSEFLKYKSNQNSRLFMTGIGSYFIVWKKQNKLISKGAVEFTMMNIMYGTVDEYIYDYYNDKLSDYPFLINNHMFSNPFCWKISDSEIDFYEYQNKCVNGFFGYGRSMSNNGFLFLTHYLKFFSEIDVTASEREKLKTIDDLNRRLFNRYIGELNKSCKFSSKLLQISYMPWKYAESVDNNGFLNNPKSKYVFSDALIKTNHIMIRYAVDTDALMKDIELATNRKVESQYFIELLYPLRKYMESDYECLVQKAEQDSVLPKEVDIISFALDYYYSEHSISFNIEDINFIKARKRIAQICSANSIKQGAYKNKDATRIVRNMQQKLIDDFESEIKKYDKMDLHARILTCLASCLHDANVNQKRYNEFHDIDKSVLNEVKQNSLKYREEFKRYCRAILYLLESNLYIDRVDKMLICQDETLDYLFAYADWLVVLQDTSDTCYHIDPNVEIEVTHEYLVNTNYSDEELNELDQTTERVYNNKDFAIRSDDIDKEFLQKAMLKFKFDTGINFEDMLLLLHYLQREFMVDNHYTEIAPNVFSVKKDVLIHDFCACITDGMDFAVAEKVMDYLIIETAKLKELNGIQNSVLPIWEREKRINRFDVKPLIINNDSIIFSPLCISDLYNKWTNGLPNFFPPYEIGLIGLTKVLDEWKKRYENLMVYDIVDIFKKAGIKHIWPNAELHTLDKSGNHPEELGDYDVLAIDTENHIIWIIESKVLRKVGSIFEYRMQQKSFFMEHEDDQKFQRRIDYFEKNFNRFFVSQKINITDAEYSINSFMVTNKVFSSRYKKIEFPIITFNELEKHISKIYDT